MDNLISRKELIEEFKKWLPKEDSEWLQFGTHPLENLSVRAILTIEEAPTIEAVPVVRGKWFGNTCSACCLNWNENMVNNADDWGYFDPMPNFCPNCGADMRKRKKV